MYIYVSTVPVAPTTAMIVMSVCELRRIIYVNIYKFVAKKVQRRINGVTSVWRGVEESSKTRNYNYLNVVQFIFSSDDVTLLEKSHGPPILVSNKKIETTFQWTGSSTEELRTSGGESGETWEKVRTGEVVVSQVIYRPILQGTSNLPPSSHGHDVYATQNIIWSFLSWCARCLDVEQTKNKDRYCARLCGAMLVCCRII